MKIDNKKSLRDLNRVFLDKTLLDEENGYTKAINRLAHKLSKGNLWIYILKMLLERKEGVYGYEIKESIAEQFGFEPATVSGYVILYKMKRDNLVEIEWKTAKEGKPNRKYYKITERGKDAMKQAKLYMQKILEEVFYKVEV
ncbi:MAG: PadR family transcriptional regulator [Promethearchaeota archaeon]|nr:MAG: PadR family transcriptional regulator [Candidatus Lokiarchaeota archaeon]